MPAVIASDKYSSGSSNLEDCYPHHGCSQAFAGPAWASEPVREDNFLEQASPLEPRLQVASFHEVSISANQNLNQPLLREMQLPVG